jgi:hypothetical protein
MFLKSQDGRPINPVIQTLHNIYRKITGWKEKVREHQQSHLRELRHDGCAFVDSTASGSSGAEDTSGRSSSIG